MTFGRDQPEPRRMKLRTGGVQELKRVSKADRSKIQLAVQANKFRRKRYENQLEAKRGPGRCSHCGAEPCGASWGPVRGDESALCCEKCDHAALPGWSPTHVFWYGRKPFFVREVRIGKAGSVYQRQDGVVQFMVMGLDVFFLGRKLASPDYARFLASDRQGLPAGVTPESLVPSDAPSTEDWDEAHDEENGGEAARPGDEYEDVIDTDLEEGEGKDSEGDDWEDDDDAEQDATDEELLEEAEVDDGDGDDDDIEDEEDDA